MTGGAALKAIAAAIASVGLALGCFGVLLGSAVLAVLLQGKSPDLLSGAIALALIALAAFALRAAWRRWRAAP